MRQSQRPRINHSNIVTIALTEYELEKIKAMTNNVSGYIRLCVEDFIHYLEGLQWV